jgi:(p)ppGpp synthase/HD superfamily hydrolase
MPEIAQTNLQLYNQLIAAGWSDADLDRTQAAYALAADLFAGQIRSSGKTFLEHLVGTASAVAAVGGRPDLVHAGLLHATYTFGEFGDGERNTTASKRAAVRAVIGAEAEELVAEYATLGYSAATIQDWQERAHMLSPREHDLAVLRLANEVDEHIDLGTRYSDRNGHPMSSDPVFETMIVLAHELDEPALADLMDRIQVDEADVAVPVVLRSRASGREVIAPRSYWRRPKLVIHQAKRGIRRRVAAVRRLWRGPEWPT